MERNLAIFSKNMCVFTFWPDNTNSRNLSHGYAWQKYKNTYTQSYLLQNNL